MSKTYTLSFRNSAGTFTHLNIPNVTTTVAVPDIEDAMNKIVASRIVNDRSTNILGFAQAVAASVTETTKEVLFTRTADQF